MMAVIYIYIYETFARPSSINSVKIKNLITTPPPHDFVVVVKTVFSFLVNTYFIRPVFSKLFSRPDPNDDDDDGKPKTGERL